MRARTAVYLRVAPAASAAAMASLFSLVPAEWLNEALKVFDGTFGRKKGVTEIIDDFGGHEELTLKKNSWAYEDSKQVGLFWVTTNPGSWNTVFMHTAQEAVQCFRDRVRGDFHSGILNAWIDGSWFEVEKYRRKYVVVLFSNWIVVINIRINQKETGGDLSIDVKAIKFESDEERQKTVDYYINEIVYAMFTPDQRKNLEKYSVYDENLKKRSELDFAEKNLPVYQQIKWRSVLQSDKALAAMMATHPRLGATSHLHHLDDTLVKNIVRSTLQEMDTKKLAEFLHAFFREGYEQALQRFQLQAQLPDVCAACGRLVLQ